MSKLLTIGMATYDDYDGVFFSIQALRMYHSLCMTDQVEFIVIDNNPTGKHSKALIKLLKTIDGKYVPCNHVTSFSKYKVADHATGKYVLIIDSHVLLMPGAIENLLKYYSETPDCKNLIQGALYYDNLKHISTHFNPEFRGHMYGVWAFNKTMFDQGEPFSIPMQGMGLLSYELKHWPQINPDFRGFGAEEGYIAEKFRQNGGDNICLPQLGWVHRFDRPGGVPFRLILEDRVFNYLLGWLEIHKDINHPMIKSIYDYFKTHLPEGVIDKLFTEAKEKLTGII